ncbi:MAG TPA: peptidase domain-containing ABC transporter [Tepidisphaeraceae bacterium]|jgi:ATP-binding cassette subfamily B protein|nr:peptidase domain-containing ABC transporter [Tepidisphaeraceae bacterium]
MDLPQKLALLASAEPFKLLDERVRAELAGHLSEKSVAFGENVFVRGNAGDAMYLIASGKARVVGITAGGEETTLAILARGDYFGDAALNSNAPRNATVRAAFELKLLRLERNDFQKLAADFPAFALALQRFLTVEGIQNFLKQSTALQYLPAHALREMIAQMQELKIPKGHVVVREGETGDRFYIVGGGVLEAVHQNGDGAPPQVVGQIGEGEFFGELALLDHTPRRATVVARSDCVLYAMTRDAFDRAVATSPQFRARLEAQVASYHLAPATNGQATTRTEFAPVDAPSHADAVDHDANAGEEAAAPPPPPAPRRWFRRYPHLLQHDETDCGAACLAMICLYYGVPVGIARLRDMANVDADGATMWSVAQAAEALGFHACGYQMGYEALADLTLPAIVHWEGYHYIVLYEVTPKRVVVADPGIALRRLDRETFLAGWTGRALELTPTAKLHSAERIRSPIRRFWPIIKPHLPLLGEVLGASLLLSILGLGVPMFTQVVVDRVIVNKSIGLLNMLLVGMLMIAGFQAILTAIRRVLLIHISVRADARLIGDFLRHVMALPMKFFDLRRVGDVVSRVTENEKVRAAITGTVPGALVDTVLTMGYVALMLVYNAKLALVSLAAIPPFVLFIITLTPAMRRSRREHSAADADAWSTLIESITGMSTIKSMATESSVRWRMEGQYVKALLAARKSAHLQTASQTAATLLQAISVTLLLWYGAGQVMAGALTVGQLLAFATLLAGIIGPTLRLIDAWDQLQDLRNGLERLNDIFDARPEQDISKALIRPTQLAGDIHFEAVTFRYSPSQEKPALAGFSVNIAAGQTIAVVGRSGSGKSTLAKLILGFYAPSQGRVSIDGHDLRTMSLNVLRRCIGVVQQEVFLFSGTVRENIATGDADIPFEQVIQAAKSAGAHEFISALGLGYDTKVGERGMSLSGGQRQRIALARALLHDPAVLVLDEATSALDTESERAIQRNLEAVTKKRTTIVIAHRLSTVRNADRILVLDNGTLVEQGTHEELVARGGLYQTLTGQQLNQ